MKIEDIQSSQKDFKNCERCLDYYWKPKHLIMPVVHEF